MKIIGIILTVFFLLGIFNWIQIQKIRTKKKEKEVTLKLMDTYMKLYWKILPEFLDGLKKEKGISKKIFGQLIAECNVSYEKLNITEKLMKHAKIEKLLKEIEPSIFKSKQSKKYQELTIIESQLMKIGEEYQKQMKELEKMKENPFIKFLLPFFKI